MFTDANHLSHLPDASAFVEGLKTVCPTACVLDAFEVNAASAQPKNCSGKPLSVNTPTQKIAIFLENVTDIHYDSLLSALVYTDEECDAIEVETRGQSRNKNWHDMRRNLLTASIAKQICHSTDLSKTAALLKKGTSLIEEHLPAPLLFGRSHESRAIDSFLKVHRYKHRKCTVTQPGLMVSSDPLFPFIACSPDGIVTCSECGVFLIEIKCLWKYRGMHPRLAAVFSGIVVKDDNDALTVVPKHKYNYQMQMQMGVTGMQLCKLVIYTYKGIHSVDVQYDSVMYHDIQSKLSDFYRTHFFQLLMAS